MKYLNFLFVPLFFILFAFILIPECFGEEMLLEEYSLEQLIEETEENIRAIEKEIAEEGLAKSRERERLAREYFEKGKQRYREGKSEAAIEEWQKV